MISGRPSHILRYGIASEEQFLKQFAESFSRLAINANMLAHTPTAISAFVGKKLVTKPFFVDPITHAFQHNPEMLKSKKTGAIKGSLRKLRESYGDPLLSIRGVVKPEDLSSDLVRRDFARRVLEFQYNTIKSTETSEELLPYLQYSGVNYQQTPEFLIAPYFFMKLGSVDRWLPLNSSLIESAKESNPSDLPIWAQVVISKDILDDRELMEKLVNAYKSVAPSGILLWVDDFAEDEVDEALLTHFISLLRAFAEAELPVINLYGGYFSFLLIKSNLLTGVAHGVEYGESRSVVPVGGGIPMAKFYYPALHRRLRYVDAVSILVVKNIFGKGATSYYEEVCNCETCQKIIGNDPNNFARYGDSKAVAVPRGRSVISLNFPLQETRQKTICHYLALKQSEFARLETIGLEELLEDLSTAYRDPDFESALGIGETDYLLRWHGAIRTLVKAT